MTVSALWFFLTVFLVDLQCLIVVFADHTHLLFAYGTPGPFIQISKPEFRFKQMKI